MLDSSSFLDLMSTRRVGYFIIIESKTAWVSRLLYSGMSSMIVRGTDFDLSIHAWTQAGGVLEEQIGTWIVDHKSGQVIATSRQCSQTPQIRTGKGRVDAAELEAAQSRVPA